MQKHMILALPALSALFLFSGCGAGAPPPAGASTPSAAPASINTPSPVLSLDPASFLAAMKQAGLPIAETVIYTADTDPNKLLGRPGQYLAKANWHDSRLPAPSAPDDPQVSDGGGVEIYADNAGAQARADYIQGLGKKMPMLAEYDYVKGPLIMRLSKSLTPAQSADYKKMLDSAPIP